MDSALGWVLDSASDLLSDSVLGWGWVLDSASGLLSDSVLGWATDD